MSPQEKTTSPAPMETLSQALERLAARGFRESFRARPGGELTVDGGEAHAPESLIVEEVVRFEGSSDPDDQAVLFALATADGRIRGTYTTSYGAPTDPANAEAIRRIRIHPSRD